VKRGGVGKMRHISLRCLFLSDLERQGVIKVKKVLGTNNPPDVLTKHVDFATRCHLLSLLGVECQWSEVEKKSAPQKRNAKDKHEDNEMDVSEE
jgi:hypothetical protein